MLNEQQRQCLQVREKRKNICKGEKHGPLRKKEKKKGDKKQRQEEGKRKKKPKRKLRKKKKYVIEDFFLNRESDRKIKEILSER